jgi:hypothetical protein
MAVIMEVYVNGERFAVAGEESLSVLSTILTAAGKLGTESAGVKRRLGGAFDVDLRVGGLTSRGGRRRDEHLNWGKRHALKPGDELRVLIREGTDYTPATERHATRDMPKSSRSPRMRYMEAKSLYFRLRQKYGTRDEKIEKQQRRRVMRDFW